MPSVRLNTASGMKQNCFKTRGACHDQKFGGVTPGTCSLIQVATRLFEKNGRERLSPSSCLLVYTNVLKLDYLVYWKDVL